MNLHFVRDYPASPDAVWRALTDPDLVRAWYMEVEGLELRVGAAFVLRDPAARGWSGVLHCQVTEIDPERRFAYRSTEPRDQLVTEVRWTLEPLGGGTRLTLDHTGFTGVRGRMTGVLLRFGWKGLLSKKLPSVIDEAVRRSVAP